MSRDDPDMPSWAIVVAVIGGGLLMLVLKWLL